MATKIKTLRVLVVGQRGLGREVAKNLILVGIHTVSLYDPTLVELRDLGASFYTSEQHVGVMSRAEDATGSLASLNPNVKVEAIPKPPSEGLLALHNVIIITEMILPLGRLMELNSFCRAQNPAIGFVFTLALGLYGFTFVDYGPKWLVTDPADISSQSYNVTRISKEQQGQVHVVDCLKLSLQDGDYVTFKNVEGMGELNSGQGIRVSNVLPYSFRIGDTTAYGEYLRGGIVTPFAPPLEMAFPSLADSLVHMHDDNHNERWQLLHIGLTALLRFYEQRGELPKLNDETETATVVHIAKKLHNAQFRSGWDCIDSRKVIANMARYARAEIGPMCSLFGGIAAQEALKVVGKFKPLQQCFHHDWFEALPLSPARVLKAPLNRYDDQMAIFGTEVQHNLESLKLLLVGAGSLGCELLKILALMGAGTNSPSPMKSPSDASSQNKGVILVADKAVVKLPHLTTHCLFRKSDLGRSKVETAAEAVRKVNPSLEVKTLTAFVKSEPSELLSEEQWDKVDCVLGAVDNEPAMGILENISLWQRKKSLLARISKTCGYTRVILPHFTELHTPIEDALMPTYDYSTITNFPSIAEHCIKWGLYHFKTLFDEQFSNLREYLTNPTDFWRNKQHLHVSVLRVLQGLLAVRKQGTFEGCLVFARDRFEALFATRIKEILDHYPAELVLNNGERFWQGHKRVPSPIQFDPKDPLHVLYVTSLASILADTFNIVRASEDSVAAILAGTMLVSSTLERLRLERENLSAEERAEFARLSAGLRIENCESLIYENDDESKPHIDFVHAAACLHARNYLGTSDRKVLRCLVG